MPGPDQVSEVIEALAQFQIDSVNVLARAHLMPLFSRLGPYDTELLIRAAQHQPRQLFEYWGHAASLIDVSLAPALAFRMKESVHSPWNAMRRVLERSPGLIPALRAEIAANGAMTARELESSAVKKNSSWWGWSDTKAALEWLFHIGELSVTERTSSFERRYDLIERVLPPQFQNELESDQAHIELVRRAAKSLGIGSLGCLADYFRLSKPRTRQAVLALQCAGELIPARVEGWSDQLWLWHEAEIPDQIQAATVISPFDSLVFERRRLMDLFEMDYRIEIYVPAHKRRFGYYVYPFLLNDSLDARVDLKADRATSRLLVQSSWVEEKAGNRQKTVARALAEHLMDLANWLGLDEVTPIKHGTLSAELCRALR